MVHRSTNASECDICLEHKQKTNLECDHSFCKECLFKILASRSQRNMSCPLCRHVTFNTTDYDINNTIKRIELNRHDEYVTYSMVIRIFYFDECHIYLVGNYVGNIKVCYTRPKSNPTLNKKIINGQVIKFSYS